MGYLWQKSVSPDSSSQRSAWRTFSAPSIHNARACRKLHGECLSECGEAASGLKRCTPCFRGLIAMSDRNAPSASFIPKIAPRCEWRRGWVTARSVAGDTKTSRSFPCSAGVRRQELTARSNGFEGINIAGSDPDSRHLRRGRQRHHFGQHPQREQARAGRGGSVSTAATTTALTSSSACARRRTSRWASRTFPVAWATSNRCACRCCGRLPARDRVRSPYSQRLTRWCAGILGTCPDRLLFPLIQSYTSDYLL